MSDSIRIDRNKWILASYEFHMRCKEHLWSEKGKAARDYLHWRGLTDETIKLWRLGYNPVDGWGKPEEWGIPGKKKIHLPKGIVIINRDEAGWHYLKIRKRIGKPKYEILKGGKIWPFGLQTYLKTAYGFLFEGEFDVMLAYQTGFFGVGYAALPAGQSIRSDWQHFFTKIEDVIVAYDSDEEGEKAAYDICKLPHFIKAKPYPIGNDLTEYWQHTQSMKEVFHYLYDQLDLIGVD